MLTADTPAHEPLYNMIKQHEGTGPRRGDKFLMYQCPAGKHTIGYGHNLDDNGLPAGIVELLFYHDVNNSILEARKHFPWFANMCEVRQAVIVDMLFQLGLFNFRKFVKTINYLEKHDFERAADEMLESQWARNHPKRAGRLSEMMRSGVWQ